MLQWKPTGASPRPCLNFGERLLQGIATETVQLVNKARTAWGKAQGSDSGFRGPGTRHDDEAPEVSMGVAKK